MKKVLLFMAAALTMAATFTACSKGDKLETVNDAPVISWEANPTFEKTAITDNMSVVIGLEAEGTIAGCTITVTSTYEMFLQAVNLIVGDAYKSDTAPVLDLVNDATAIGALSQLGMACGSNLAGKTSVEMNLSSLVPMIKSLGAPAGSEHTFTVTLTDAEGQSTTQAITFYIAGLNSVMPVPKS